MLALVHVRVPVVALSRSTAPNEVYTRAQARDTAPLSRKYSESSTRPQPKTLA